MNKQDFKIKEKYFIDLDQYFDINKLNSLHSEIVRGVVLSKEYTVPIELGNQDALYDKKHKDPILFIKHHFYNTEEFNSLIKLGFTDRQIYEYVLLKFPVMTLGNKILLRTYENYSSEFTSKHLEDKNRDQACYQHFLGLKKWIDDSGAFSQIGRIIIFINDKGGYTPVHCDYQNLKSRKDQFIWINLTNRKKFFVLDSSFKKVYTTGVINTFDNAAWHGSEPADYACFSIRIDGLFSKKFLTETKLYEHYY
jgi:hypothetical protein